MRPRRRPHTPLIPGGAAYDCAFYGDESRLFKLDGGESVQLSRSRIFRGRIRAEGRSWAKLVQKFPGSIIFARAHNGSSSVRRPLARQTHQDVSAAQIPTLQPLSMTFARIQKPAKIQALLHSQFGLVRSHHKPAS